MGITGTILYVLAPLLLAGLTGCRSGHALELRALDGQTAKELSGVQVQLLRTDYQFPFGLSARQEMSELGETGAHGRLSASAVRAGDMLVLSANGYHAARVRVRRRDVQIVSPVPPLSWNVTEMILRATHFAYDPKDIVTMPLAADGTITVPLYPSENVGEPRR